MADFFLSNLKSTLDNCITELDEIHSMFCRNPESDFTRNRKLSFREYMYLSQLYIDNISWLLHYGVLFDFGGVLLQ